MSSTDFLRRMKRAAPMVIKMVLTDNGSQFIGRFTSNDQRASGNHAFDLVCTELGIELTARAAATSPNQRHGLALHRSNS